MSQRKRAAMFGLVLWLPVLAAGCSPGLTFNETVEGIVQIDGTPLAHVPVQFVPDLGPDKPAPASTAVTDAKGMYRLQCENGKPGAAIGKHRVVVMPGRTSLRRGEEPSAEQSAAFQLTAKNPPVPPRYAIAAQTPLHVEVTATKTKYDLNLHADMLE
jgi:hypothetical protein